MEIKTKLTLPIGEKSRVIASRSNLLDEGIKLLVFKVPCDDLVEPINVRRGERINFDRMVYTLDRVIKKSNKDGSLSIQIDKTVDPHVKRECPDAWANVDIFHRAALEHAKTICRHRFKKIVRETDEQGESKNVEKIEECDCLSTYVIDYRYLHFTPEMPKSEISLLGSVSVQSKEEIKCVACTKGLHNTVYLEELGPVCVYFKTKHSTRRKFRDKYIYYLSHDEDYDDNPEVMRVRRMGYMVSAHWYIEDHHSHVHLFTSKASYKEHTIDLFCNFIRKHWGNEPVKTPFHFNYPIKDYLIDKDLLYIALTIQYLLLVGVVPKIDNTGDNQEILDSCKRLWERSVMLPDLLEIKKLWSSYPDKKTRVSKSVLDYLVSQGMVSNLEVESRWFKGLFTVIAVTITTE